MKIQLYLSISTRSSYELDDIVYVNLPTQKSPLPSSISYYNKDLFLFHYTSSQFIVLELVSCIVVSQRSRWLSLRTVAFG